MSTVAQDVQQIREAIYGREVREAIADGIEHCYSDVSSGVTTANTAAVAANAAAQRANTAAAGAEGIPGTASLEDINHLKAAFNLCTYKIDTSVFVKGGIDENGKDASYFSESRARTVNTCYSLSGFSICATDLSGTAQLVVYVMNSKNQCVSKRGWVSSAHIPKGTNCRILLSLDPSTNVEKTVEEILAGFTFIPDSKRVCQGGTNANGADDDNWMFRHRLRDSEIQYAEKATTIIPFGSKYTVNRYSSSGSFIDVTGWMTKQYTIPANTYYRCCYTIDDSVVFSPDEFNSRFEIVTETDFAALIQTGDYKRLFRRGTYNGSSYDSFESERRITTTMRLCSSKDIIVYHNQGTYDIRFFNESDSEEQYLHWRTNDIYIPAGQRFTINIWNNSVGSSTATLEELFGCVSFEIMNNNAIGLSPNVIIQCRNVDDTRIPPYTKWYIQAAAHNQYDRVRVNIRVTTDGHFVLIHNDTINEEARNLDGTEIQESINSSGQSLATLNSYDWGIRYGSKYAGSKVPEFEEACKYAANYNLGLSIETTDIGNGQQVLENIDSIVKILSKYGLLENLIVITASGSYFSEMNYWKTKNKYISYFIGGTPADIMTWKTQIDALMTGYNSIYVMPYPFGAVADQELIDFCMENGYRLYNSSAMSKAQLFDLVGFNHGNTLIEANNVYAVKNIIHRHADSLVDSV